MSFGPGRRCVSMTSGLSIFAMTFWSFRERVEVGNWKRYKIGDSVVVARRFQFDYLFNILVLFDICSFASPSPPCVGSLVSAFSHTLFSAALLIPPMHTSSAIMGLQFVLFSHHPRTDMPSSQHKLLGDPCLALAPCDFVAGHW